MACRGVYFALNGKDVQNLLNANGDEEVMEVVQEDIEERWDENWLQETDKAWDAMHRCLNDGTLECSESSILEKCVLGGKQLYQGDDYIVSFLTSDEVDEVSKALEPIQQDWFRKKYFGLKKKFLWFDFTEYEAPIGEDDFQYTWTYFEDTCVFFKRASEANRAIVFTVDQ